MNKISVTRHDGGELMAKCDKEFIIVTHHPEEDSRANYSGEFLIMDNRSVESIKDKVKELKDEIDNKVV